MLEYLIYKADKNIMRNINETRGKYYIILNVSNEIKNEEMKNYIILFEIKDKEAPFDKENLYLYL